MKITSILLALLVACHPIFMAKASKEECETRNMMTEWETVKKTKNLKEPRECKIAEMYISDGSRLGNIIASLIEEQDFSSYNNVDFDVATEWFLNKDNHPHDLPTGYDEYMKVRAV